MLTFLKEVKEELLKVVWPTRRETVMYTLTVIVFSAVVALILGFADVGLIKLFEKIIN